jgi:uncharacterized protein (TIGR02246 family)
MKDETILVRPIHPSYFILFHRDTFVSNTELTISKKGDQHMRCKLLSIGMIVAVSAVIAQSVPSRSEPKKEVAGLSAQDDDKAQSKSDHSADEAAIRANIERFVKAYNAGDAKAIAALFAPDGEIHDKEGNEAEGRQAIEKTFAKIFQDTPEKKIEVFVESIRFIGSDMALEVGTTKETEPNEPPDIDRYTVIHVKRDGKWQMALARDTEGPPPTGREQLRPLAWLVGEWVDDDGSTVVASTCRWSKDGNFLLQEFTLQVEGRDEMQVTQRIGWDPLAKRVHAWVFDSEGGYGESVWTRDGDAWVIKAAGIRSDGKTASATNVLVPAGPDGYVWRSTDRVIGDEVSPPVEVKVIRKPPEPRE